MTGKGEVVVVTGANGFIATWVIKLLLERGYVVRGTVRDPDNVAKVGHLMELPGATERLVLYKADLLSEGAFDNIITDGVACVFHTASPVPHESVPDPEINVVQPAVEGTLNVLKAATRVESVKRVVFTSSTSAVWCNGKPYDSETIIDETWWADKEWCRKNDMWYNTSKTEAEQAAWEFAKDKAFDLVALNPSVVLGPLLQETLNSSSRIILKLLNGTTKKYPNRHFAHVHVKDVALAHVLAYEDLSAEGRYILCDKAIHYAELTNLLRVLCPGCPVPTECVDDGPQVVPKVNSEKARKLLGSFATLEETLKDCIAALKAKTLLKC